MKLSKKESIHKKSLISCTKLRFLSNNSVTDILCMIKWIFLSWKYGTYIFIFVACVSVIYAGLSWDLNENKTKWLIFSKNLTPFNLWTKLEYLSNGSINWFFLWQNKYFYKLWYDSAIKYVTYMFTFVESVSVLWVR